MRPERLGDLAVFRMVASERSFTKAAARLGVTQSALSQTMKRLEAELGVKLLARTTRSVSPTDAGEQLLRTLSPALSTIEAELEALADYRDRPIGTVRITTGKHAAQTVLWPALTPLLRTHPDIQVEVSVSSAYVDIVAERFDAGIRMGAQLEKDMIAVPIGPKLRTAVVGAPSYFERHSKPKTPQELVTHRCIGFRNDDGGLYAWEFEKRGRALSVRVGGGPVLNDGTLLVRAAVEGLGLLHTMEDMVTDALAAGTLVRVLADWCEPFAGYHLYYPSRQQQTQAFKLVVEALRSGRRRS